MEFEPKLLVFKEIRLNQVYSTSLCITNPLNSSIDFTIRCSSSRFTVTPNKVHLNAGQSIVITVKLFLNHFPSKDERNESKATEDYLHVKSSVFEQRVPIETYVHRVPRGHSRSPSPLSRVNKNTREEVKASDVIEELQMQLEVKDNRIKEIESLLGKLEGKYPDLQDIIAARVAVERDSFEEKSAKILAILKRKDDHIQILEEKVEEQSDLISSYRQTYVGQKDPALTKGSTIQPHDNYQQVVAENKKLIKELQKTKEKLIKVEEELDLLQSERNSSHSDISLSSKMQQQTRELIGMKEKVVDQAEKIEVLLEELSKRNDDDKELSIKMQELDYLRREKQILNKRLRDQEAKYSELNQSYNSLVKERSNIGLQALEALSKGFETQVEGGIATSTPYHFDLPQNHPAQSNPISSMATLQARCTELEERLKDMSAEEIRLREILNEKEGELRVMQEHNHLLKQQNDSLERKVVPESQGMSSTESVARVSISNHPDNTQQVHDWWSYVWHTAHSLYLSNAYASSKDGGKESNTSKPGDFEYEAADTQDKDYHIHKMREHMKQTAIDLATARQDLLALKLSLKQETTSLKAQITQLLNENKSLLNNLGHSKNNKEVVIKQLQSTVQILSSKSELHMQIYQVSRELETEKVLNNNLQLDILKLNNIISDKTNQISLLEQEKIMLNQQLDSVDLIKTLYNIPGVHVYHAINIFAHELGSAKKKSEEYAKDIKQLQEQLQDCQKLLENSRNLSKPVPSSTVNAMNINTEPEPNARETNANASILFSPPNPAPSRSRTHIRNILASPNAAALTPTEAASTHFASSPVKTVKVSDHTTVDGLLQAYDNAVLLNTLRQYENKTAQLEQDLHIYQDICSQTQNVEKYGLEQYNKILSSIQQLSPPQGAEPNKQSDFVYNITLHSEQLAYDLIQQKYFLAEKELQLLQEKHKQLQHEYSSQEEELMKCKKQAVMINGSYRSMLEDHNDSVSTLPGMGSNTNDNSHQVKVLEMENKLLQDTIKTLSLQSPLANNMEGLSEEMPPIFQDVSTNQSYAVQIYIQRIIELTAELSTYQREHHVSQESMQELQLKYQKLFKKYNKLNHIASAIEEENLKFKEEIEKSSQSSFEKDAEMRKIYNKVQQDHQELQKKYNELKYSHDHLSLTHHNLELKYQHICSEFSQQLLNDVKQEIQSVKQLTPAPITQGGADGHKELSSKGGASIQNPVIDLVQNLLSTWKEHYQISSQSSVYLDQPKTVSTAAGLNSLYSNALQNSNTSTNQVKLNKNETKYLQKISNLVLSCSQSIESYQEKYQTLESKYSTLSQQYNYVNNLFAHILQDYINNKNLNHMFHSVHLNDKYHVQIEHAHQIRMFYQRKLNNYHTYLYKYIQEYNMLYKQYVQSLVSNKIKEHRLNTQKKKLVSQESKGHALLQAKEYLADQQGTYIQDVYTNVQTWFQKELTSLLYHLPLQSSMQNYGSQNNLGYVQSNGILQNIYEQLFQKHNIKPADRDMPFPNTASTPLNTDLIYSLCQSLCEYKSQLTLLEMQLHKANQQKKVLEDKLLDSDSIIDRYIHSSDMDIEIDVDGQTAHTFKLIIRDALSYYQENSVGPRDLTEPRNTIEDSVLILAESLFKAISSSKYLHSNISVGHKDSQSDPCLELEESNIELKHKNQRLMQSMQSYKQLLQQYQQVLQRNKQTYQNNMYKITYNLERQYMDKVQSLQDYYEQERNVYIHELNNISSALPHNDRDVSMYEQSFNKENVDYSNLHNISLQNCDVQLDPYLDQHSLYVPPSGEPHGESMSDEQKDVFQEISHTEQSEANPVSKTHAPNPQKAAATAQVNAAVNTSLEYIEDRAVKANTTASHGEEKSAQPSISPSVPYPAPSLPPSHPPLLSPSALLIEEEDFREEEKSIYLLRDLRQKVDSIQREYEARLAHEREKYEKERKELERELGGYKEIAQKYQLANETKVDTHSNRDYYEDLMKKMEKEYTEHAEHYKQEIKTLEEQMTALKMQSIQSIPSTNSAAREDLLQSFYNDKLTQQQSLLHQTNFYYTQELQHLHQEFNKYKQINIELIHSLEQQIEDFATSTSKSENLSDLIQNIPVHSNNLYLGGEDNAEEQVKTLEYKYKSKCAELDTVMKAINAIGEVGFSQDVSSVQIEAFAPPPRPPLPPAPSQSGRGIAMQREEIEGRSMSLDDSQPPFEAPHYYHQPSTPAPVPLAAHPSLSPPTPPSPPMDVSSLKQQMLQARLASAEKEVEALQRRLTADRTHQQMVREQYERLYLAYQQLKGEGEKKERERELGGRGESVEKGEVGGGGEGGGVPAQGNSSAGSIQGREQIVQMGEKFLREYTKDFSLPVQIEESEGLRGWLRKVNQLRREARQVISAMRLALLESPPPPAPTGKTPGGGSAAQIITQLREENARKQKLILAYKEAKLADNNNLEQWKNEARSLDAQIKRLRALLLQRENSLRDLQQKQGGEGAGAGGIGGLGGAERGGERGEKGEEREGEEIGEVKLKLKESELERGRMRMRVQALRERVGELEGEGERLRGEVERLQKGVEKGEGLRAQLQRREGVIRQQRGRLEQLERELGELRESSEKKIRQLQRQVESAQRQQGEQWEELQVLRERLLQQGAPGGSPPPRPHPAPPPQPLPQGGRRGGGPPPAPASPGVSAKPPNRDGRETRRQEKRGGGERREESREGGEMGESIFDSLWVEEEEEREEEREGAYVFARDRPPYPTPAPLSAPPATAFPPSAPPATTSRSLGSSRRDIEEVLSALHHNPPPSLPPIPPLPPLAPQPSHGTPSQGLGGYLSEVSTPSTAQSNKSVLSVEQRLQRLVQSALHSPLRK